MLNATKLESNLDGSWLLLFNSKSGSFLSAFAKTRVHSSSVIRVSSSKGPLVKILAEIEVSINT